jgi:hypothetical protein
MKRDKETKGLSAEVRIPAGRLHLQGTLDLPDACTRVVVFAHGSGSSRFSPRNRFVAGQLSGRAIGTLLLDLLTPEEDLNYRTRFDIHLLATRLTQVTDWLNTRPQAPVPEPRQRWRQPPRPVIGSGPLSRAAAAPIWRKDIYIWCAARPCSSWAVTIGKF